jgi:membrane protein implicated in regulation of membrane protease activity
MLTMQGLSAAVAGTLAQLTSPGTAMTLMAAASAAVTLTLAALAREGRRKVPEVQTAQG